MPNIVLGSHPEALTVRLVRGDGAPLAASITDPAGDPISWPATPRLEFSSSRAPGSPAEVTVPAVVAGSVASWTLTTTQVESLWVLANGGPTYVRLQIPGEGDGTVSHAGRVMWQSGWTGGTGIQTLTTYTATTGPAGPQGPAGPPGASTEAATVAAVAAAASAVSAAASAELADVIANSIDEGPVGPAGPSGPSGAPGAAGPQGPAGDDGLGVPVGGADGQILAKASATDHDTEWVDAPSGGGGALDDTGWRNVSTLFADRKQAGGQLDVHVRRIGPFVYWDIGGYYLVDGTSDNGLPSGFRPRVLGYPSHRKFPVLNNGVGLSAFTVYTDGKLGVASGSGEQWGPPIFYLTDEAWPVTLPGTAV